MQISPKKSEQLMIIIKQQKNLWKCIKKSHNDIQQTREWENCVGRDKDEEYERKLNDVRKMSGVDDEEQM